MNEAAGGLLPGQIELEFGDGVYRFGLPIGMLRELQGKCGAGPPIIQKRVAANEWLADDIPEIIRCGLIGGGMPPTEAMLKTRQYVLSRPPMENWLIATAIIGVALTGVGGEEFPKLLRASKAKASRPAKMESSPSLTSMAGQPSSASRRARSTSSRYGSSAASSPAT